MKENGLTIRLKESTDIQAKMDVIMNGWKED